MRIGIRLSSSTKVNSTDDRSREKVFLAISISLASKHFFIDCSVNGRPSIDFKIRTSPILVVELELDLEEIPSDFDSDKDN